MEVTKDRVTYHSGEQVDILVFGTYPDIGTMTSEGIGCGLSSRSEQLKKTNHTGLRQRTRR